MALNILEPKVRRWSLMTAFTRRPQRPLILLVVGAALGLLAAGFGLFRPADQVVRTVPPGYVALVNGRGILMSDFMSQTEAETSMPFAQTTPEQRRKVLHEMIDEELLVQRALALDFPELDTNVRMALVDAINSQVSAPILARRPSDTELQRFFNANREKYASGGIMQLTDIALHFGGIEDADQTVEQAEADAAQAVYQLRSGASLDYVMQHFGFSRGHINGGKEFDFAAKIHLGPKLFAAASELGDGDISDPVTDTDGVHVMIMRHRQAPFEPGFDKVRNNVYSDYMAAAQTRAQQQSVEFLHANADILLLAPGQSQ
jgi:peptidyl-prolyl cis-trans isomerase C